MVNFGTLEGVWYVIKSHLVVYVVNHLEKGPSAIIWSEIWS